MPLTEKTVVDNLEFIDTHAHVHRVKDEPRGRFFRELYGERGQSIKKIINIAISYEENIDAMESVEGGGERSVFKDKLRDSNGVIYDKVNYFAHGIHPKEVPQTVFGEAYEMSDSIDEVKNIDSLNENIDAIFQDLYTICSMSDSRCVAIGETGYEFFYSAPYKYKDLQTEFYRRHIELAHKLELPLIIHHRSHHDISLGRENANQEGIKLLRENKGLLKDNPGVIHCFFGNYEEAAIFCHEMSFVLGVGAAFLDERNEELREVFRKIPLDNLVLETDTPFLKPKFINSGYKQNTPLNIPYIANELAKLKGVSIEEVAKVTTENALRVFPGLKT